VKCWLVFGRGGMKRRNRQFHVSSFPKKPCGFGT
jgi:hypothetical protein